MSARVRMAGLSLVELLVALALGALLLMPLVSLLRSSAAASATASAQTDLQLQAQFAMRRMLARVAATPAALLPAKASDSDSGTWLAPALYDLRTGSVAGTLALTETVGGVSSVLAEPVTSLSISSPEVNTVVVIALTLARNDATVALRESARLGGFR
jgi:Tfp pilus assembly protein PilV